MTTPLKFGSVCSGIEAASVAWSPLGWSAAWLSEIEKFPSAVLSHHYPETINYGDMTNLSGPLWRGEIEAPDILCGGTPCQAFSVAGLRNSLADARGNLSLTFCDIANAIDSNRTAMGEPPAIIVWENVPGVLNTSDNAFGCFLAGLAGESEPLVPSGGKWTNAGLVSGPERSVAWRVLDAQYFGVAQRRRRVFVVASARKDFDPGAVLFEFGGGRRDIAPSRPTGEVITGPITAGIGKGMRGTEGVDSNWMVAESTFTLSGFAEFVPTEIAGTLRQRGNKEATDVVVSVGGDLAHTLTAVGYDASEDETGRGTPIVGGDSQSVRRLTCVECERLQGFPDGYTDIKPKGKPTPDGPRFKALGNSWAVPVVHWIGRRIVAEIDKNGDE